MTRNQCQLSRLLPSPTYSNKLSGDRRYTSDALAYSLERLFQSDNHSDAIHNRAIDATVGLDLFWDYMNKGVVDSVTYPHDILR